MMRSLRLLPRRRWFSNTWTSAGALIEIQPAAFVTSGLAIEMTSDAVVPPSIVTCSVTRPDSFSRTTVCMPGVRPETVIGERPENLPSTVIDAREGSVRI